MNTPITPNLALDLHLRAPRNNHRAIPPVISKAIPLNIAYDMAFPTFQLFSKLPFELRQQIWKESCRERHEDRRGLHYIRMDRNRELAPFDCSWDATGRKNRSAYLWHAGLWTACKESRDIVAKQWHYERFPNVPAETKYISLRDTIWFVSDIPDDAQWASSDTTGDYEPWHIIISPSRDMFCITADDWEPLAKDWRPINLNAEDHSVFEDSWFLENIALKFDPSWNPWLATQYSYYPIKKHPASLAFLMRFMFDMAHSDCMEPKLRLIDDNARWVEDESNEREVFCDCDHDYVEIENDSESSPSRRIVSGSPILEFLGQLNRLLLDTLSRIYHSRDCLRLEKHLGMDMFSIEAIIVVVVRRDNRISKEEF